MIKFEYNPEFQTIVKYSNNENIGSLSVQESEFEQISFLLWSYLQNKKFSILVDEETQKSEVE